MEQLDYNLLFRWFVGLNMDDLVWDATVFTKNRDRVLGGEVAKVFFQEVLAEARRRSLLSDEHFTVDGTLIEAWASHKSFKPKDQSDSDEGGSNPSVDFRRQRRTNDTHASRTDPEARLYKKSKGAESRLCYMGHLMIDKPPRVSNQRLRNDRFGNSRTRGRRADGGRDSRKGPGNLGGRQGLRHARLHPKASRSQHHPARRTERHETGAAPSTAARPGTRATRSVRRNASSSSRCSDGPRRSG